MRRSTWREILVAALAAVSAPGLEAAKDVADAQTHVVVAHYNEDLSWISKYKSPDVKFHVYSKGELSPETTLIYPNVGRESHTYLAHIVNNYDKLPPWVVFTQGAAPTWGYRANDASSGHLTDKITFEDYLEPHHKGKDAFFAISGATALPTGEQTARMGIMTDQLPSFSNDICPLDGPDGWTDWWLDVDHPHHKAGEDMLQFYNKHILPNSDDEDSLESIILGFAQGGRFAVSRDRVHSRPVSFYQDLLQAVSKEQNPIEGYFLEAMWYDVFHPEKPQASKPLCQYAIRQPGIKLTPEEMYIRTARLLGSDDPAAARMLSSPYGSQVGAGPSSTPEPEPEPESNATAQDNASNATDHHGSNATDNSSSTNSSENQTQNGTQSNESQSNQSQSNESQSNQNQSNESQSNQSNETQSNQSQSNQTQNNQSQNDQTQDTDDDYEDEAVVTEVVRTTSIDVVMTVPDNFTFDEDAYTQSMNLPATAEVVHEVKASLDLVVSFDANVPKSKVGTIIAAANGVSADNVTVTEKTSRRLRADSRRLNAVEYDIEVKVAADKIAEVKAKAGNTTLLEAAADAEGVPAPAIQEMPTAKVKIVTTVVVRQPEGETPVAMPTAESVKTAAAAAAGVDESAVTVQPITTQEQTVTQTTTSRPRAAPKGSNAHHCGSAVLTLMVGALAFVAV